MARAHATVAHPRYQTARGNNRLLESELAFGKALIMVGQMRDDAYGAMVGGPQPGGGKSVYLAVDDVDAAAERARTAGAEILEEPADRDYGSREFICRDPEGNVWTLGTYWPKVKDPG